MKCRKQVELAQLKYSAAHLVQSGAAGRDSGYDRQGGGKGAMGGAGEKELEIQRRLLRDRAAEVGKLLKEVEKRRGVQRRTRDRRREPTVRNQIFTALLFLTYYIVELMSHHRYNCVFHITLLVTTRS